jgi:hypothetical protein
MLSWDPRINDHKELAIERQRANGLRTTRTVEGKTIKWTAHGAIPPGEVAIALGFCELGTDSTLYPTETLLWLQAPKDRPATKLKGAAFLPPAKKTPIIAKGVEFLSLVNQKY